MPSPTDNWAAIVVATAHDSPTSFVAEAASRVVGLLEAAGWRVRFYLGHDAHPDNIYVGLREFHVSHPDSRIRLGFFSAHGSDGGLHIAQVPGGDSQGELLLDVESLQQFQESVLVFLSCSATGRFPERIISLPPSPARPSITPVVVVIGYRDVLRVPPCDFILRVASQEVCDRLTSIFVAHAELLLQGMSVPDVVQGIQARWREELLRPSQPMEVQLVCLANLKNIRSWPQESPFRLA